MACPLLLGIAAELPGRLPAIFGDEPLVELWGFKYEAEGQGTALHADSAALHVNFWVTPNEANLTPERSGLVLYDRLAPANWDFAKYNTDQVAIGEFLEAAGARKIVIPHRRNRCVLFDSGLFHRTDDFRFRGE